MTDTTQLQPGPELDEKVCKALGIGRKPGMVIEYASWDALVAERPNPPRFYPPVSTDWRELHGLLGALYNMFSITVWRHVGVSSVGTGWYVALGRSIHAAHPYSQRQEHEWRARSKELPHAICLAALAALSEDRTK